MIVGGVKRRMKKIANCENTPYGNDNGSFTMFTFDNLNEVFYARDGEGRNGMGVEVIGPRGMDTARATIGRATFGRCGRAAF